MRLNNHPALSAIARLKRAKLSGAHPRMIKHLERQARIEARRSGNRLSLQQEKAHD